MLGRVALRGDRTLFLFVFAVDDAHDQSGVRAQAPSMLPQVPEGLGIDGESGGTIVAVGL
jgi:hypothetical protein